MQSFILPLNITLKNAVLSLIPKMTFIIDVLAELLY